MREGKIIALFKIVSEQDCMMVLPQETDFSDPVSCSYVCFGGAITEWNENVLLGKLYYSKFGGVFFCFNDAKFCLVDYNIKI